MAELMNLANVLQGVEGIKGARIQNALGQQQLDAQNMLMQQRAQFSPLYAQALQGDPGAMNQLAQAAPQLASEAMKQAQAMQAFQKGEYEQRSREATDLIERIDILSGSANAKKRAIVSFPEMVEEMEQASGTSIEDMSEEDFRGLLNDIRMKAAPLAEAPNYTLKEGIGPTGELGYFSIDPNTQSVKPVSGVTPPPKAPLVQIDTGDKAKGKGREKLEQNAADQIAALAERSDIAVTNLANAAQLERDLDAMEREGVSTGTFAKFSQGLANMAQSLGAGAAFVQGLASSENFEAVSNRMQFAETQILKGAISEKEQEVAGRINTQIGKSPLGNRFAVKRMRAMSNAALLHDQLIGEMRSQNPDMELDQVVRKAKQKMRSLPYISRHKEDERGLPVFFPTFYANAKERLPGTTLEKAIEAWNLMEEQERKNGKQ